jgi:hypothetical protein
VVIYLNPSGILHASAACARRGWVFDGDGLLGFLYLPFRGLCRRCCR